MIITFVAKLTSNSITVKSHVLWVLYIYIYIYLFIPHPEDICICIYPEMAKPQSNHRFYKSDIKPAIDHSDSNYKTRTLTWSKLKMKH